MLLWRPQRETPGIFRENSTDRSATLRRWLIPALPFSGGAAPLTHVAPLCYPPHRSGATRHEEFSVRPITLVGHPG